MPGAGRRERLLGSGDDADDPAPLAGAEVDGAGGQSEQRVVAAATHTVTGVEVSTTLAHDDLTGVDELTTEALDTESLSVGVATVAGAGRTFLMCHV